MYLPPNVVCMSLLSILALLPVMYTLYFSSARRQANFPNLLYFVFRRGIVWAFTVHFKVCFDDEVKVGNL